MENILQKVRGLVPFVRDWSQVKYYGECHDYVDESYTKTHRWQNGWREEGQLLLDAQGNPIGTVYHVESNGRGETWEDEPDIFPEGKPKYLLFYNVKFDTEEEEWACLYKVL
jgi:hypothetical protein